MASPESFDYADRLCARLPGRLREAAGIGCHELARRCGVTRQMIWQIESGKSIPTVHVVARLAPGLGVKLCELVRALEDR